MLTAEVGSKAFWVYVISLMNIASTIYFFSTLLYEFPQVGLLHFLFSFRLPSFSKASPLGQ
jgi:hypothetical protein